MNANLLPDDDTFIAAAIHRLPDSSRKQALEIGAGQVSPPLSCFRAARILQLDALSGLPPGEFNFVLAASTFDERDSPAPVIGVFRESSRLLLEHGLLCAAFSARLSTAELAELAHDLDFQILAFEGTGSRRMSILWRKRAPGWRANLADQAGLATTRISSIVNSWDHEPVVPSRGRYAAISMDVEGLPLDMDLLDLEVYAGGIRANATSISEPDASGRQRIEALLPSLEQTGLIPLELRWFGETITNQPVCVRVIPPGPTVPRVIRVTPGPSRMAGIAVLIEELARPDQFSATIAGVPVWGIETACVNPNTLRYDVRFQLPDQIPAGVHEVHMMAGRRKLPPVMIEIQ